MATIKVDIDFSQGFEFAQRLVDRIDRDLASYAAKGAQASVTRSAKKTFPRRTGKLIQGVKVTRVSPTRIQLKQTTKYWIYHAKVREWQFGSKARTKTGRRVGSEVRKAMLRGSRNGVRRLIKDIQREIANDRI